MQTSFTKKNGDRQCGFTLTELWVVVVTIAILVAVALPALAGKDRVFSTRTQCANRLRQIGVAVTAYAGDNSGYVLSAWPDEWALYPNTNTFNQYGIYIGSGACGYDQHFLFPSQTDLLKLVYLAPSLSNTIWRCPSIGLAGLPAYNPGQKQLLIGYGYYGGVTWWQPESGSPFHSLSPVNLGTSKPYWILADDLVVHYPGRAANEAWGIGNGTIADIPHRRPGTVYPDGGNQLDADGSVQWAKIETMDACNSEGGRGSGIWDFMYQANLARDLTAVGAPAGFLNMLNAGFLTPVGQHLLQ